MIFSNNGIKNKIIGDKMITYDSQIMIHDIVTNNNDIIIFKKAYDTMCGTSLPTPKFYKHVVTHNFLRDDNWSLGIHSYANGYPFISISSDVPDVLKPSVIYHEMAHYCKQHIVNQNFKEFFMMDCLIIILLLAGLFFGIYVYSMVYIFCGLFLSIGLIILRRHRYISWVLQTEEEAERLATSTLLEQGNIEAVGYHLSILHCYDYDSDSDNKIKTNMNTQSRNSLNHHHLSLYEKWNKFITDINININYSMWIVQECYDYGYNVYFMYNYNNTCDLPIICSQQSNEIIFKKSARYYSNSHIYVWTEGLE